LETLCLEQEVHGEFYAEARRAYKKNLLSLIQFLPPTSPTSSYALKHTQNTTNQRNFLSIAITSKPHITTSLSKMQFKLLLTTALLSLAVTLVRAVPSPLTASTSLEVLGEGYVSPFDYDVVNTLVAAGNYDALKEMYSQFWNSPTAAEYGVCETSQASPPTNEAYGAVDDLNRRDSCCQWNALHTQCSNLTNRGGASVGFCGAYKACLQCSPFARDRMSSVAFWCAQQGSDGVFRSGGKWMLDGAGPGARLILY